MAKTATIATLVANLELNSASFRKEMDMARARTKKLGGEMSKAGAAAVAFGRSMRKAANTIGIASAGAAAGLAVVVKRSLATNDALAKTADRLGLTTKALAGLQHASQLSGVSARTLEMGLQRMTRRVSEAAQGTGEAKDAIKELGLDAQRLAQLSPDKQFQTIAGAMGQVANQGDRVRLAMKLFDSEGVALVNTLDMGAAGLNAAAAEAERFGVALSRTDAAKMEAANDAMFRASQVAQGLGNQLTIQLAPIIEEVAVQFTNAMQAGGGMGEVVNRSFAAGVKVAGVFADGIHGLKIIFKGVEVIARGFAAAVVGGLDLAIKAAVRFANNFKNTVLFPLRAALEAAAYFSDDAKAILEDFNRLTADAKPPKALGEAFNTIVDGLRDVRTELHDMMMAELPSEILKGKVDEILAAAEARAQQMVATKLAQSNSAGAMAGTGGGAGGDGLSESERNQLASRVEALKLSWLSEQEQMAVKHDEEMALLDTAYAEKLMKTDEYERSLTELEKKHKKERDALEQAANKSKLSLFTEGAGQILGAMSAHSKKAAALQMGMAVFTAGAAMVENIAQASKIGFPQNIPMIAGATAQGLQIVGMLNNIKEPAGIAHGGLDYVPAESTYLLDKGERVLSPNQNADLTSALKNGGMGTKVTVNLVEDSSRGGQVEQRRGSNAEEIIDVFVANIRQGGDAAAALETTYGMSRTGTI